MRACVRSHRFVRSSENIFSSAAAATIIVAEGDKAAAAAVFAIGVCVSYYSWP